MNLASQYASSASGYVNTVLDVVLAALIGVIIKGYFSRKSEDKERWKDMNDAMKAQTGALNLIVQRVGDYGIPGMKDDIVSLKTATSNLKQAVRQMGGTVND